MFGDFENIQIGATDRYLPANQIGVYWVETEQQLVKQTGTLFAAEVSCNDSVSSLNLTFKLCL